MLEQNLPSWGLLLNTASTQHPSLGPSVTDDLAGTPHAPHIAEEEAQER
jgi:hypothetical protein